MRTSFLGKVHVMPSKYDPETRAKAVRLGLEHRDDYPSEWAAITAVSKRLGLNAETLQPACRGLPGGGQPFVLFANPTHHVGVNARQEGIQCGTIEGSVVLHPSPHDGVDLSGDLAEVEPDPAVPLPSADLIADLVLGLLANSWLERDEHRSVFRARGTGTKGEPQERKRRE